MRRIISALLFCVSSWALAQNAAPLELAPGAPDRHIVVPGDTLWGIAAEFLKDPYRWPEIWRLNPEEVKNPHRIYPGQVVILDKGGDKPQLKLGKLVKAEPRVYVDASKQAIPAIPQHVIEPFLTRPLVIEAGGFDNTARIVAAREGRVTIGTGDTIFATGVTTKAAQWQIFRAGEPIRDPADPEQVLGFEAAYLGSAKQTAEGEPARFEITSARQEIGANDYLVPAPSAEIVSYVPHAPTQAVNGHIVNIYGGVGEAGKFSIVALSRGKRDGMEIGHVLAIYRAGETVSNFVGDRREEYKLPEERYGLVFVFRVFERVSYALVMAAPRPVRIGDAVRKP